MSAPNRWLHVRLPRPFTEVEFDSFCAQAEIWCKYVQATLDVWPRLGETYPAPRYEFFAPELSADRCVATLPVGGEWTLGTRSLFENADSRLLWQHLPIELQLEGEEGITETIAEQQVTHWRPLLRREAATPPPALDASETASTLGADAHPDRLSPIKRALLWVGGVLPRS